MKPASWKWAAGVSTVNGDHCETCGRETVMDVKLCGRCAEDWNAPGGRAVINRRRKRNGLPPLST